MPISRYAFRGVAGLFLIAGCSQINHNDLVLGIVDGLDKIPIARQFDEVFGKENVDHFVSHSGSKVPTIWNSEVFVNGRYTITMQVEVEMSSRFNEVLAVVGEPNFYFVELSSSEWEDGQLSASSTEHPEIPYPFHTELWQRLYDAEGDFRVLSPKLELNPERLALSDKYEALGRAPRLKIPR